MKSSKSAGRHVRDLVSAQVRALLPPLRDGTRQAQVITPPADYAAFHADFVRLASAVEALATTLEQALDTGEPLSAPVVQEALARVRNVEEQLVNEHEAAFARIAH